MLVITRREGERIVIGDDVEITIVAVGRRSIRVGIRAPVGTRILRGEIYESIAEANREATVSVVPQSQSGPATSPHVGPSTDPVVEVVSLNLAPAAPAASRHGVVIEERHGRGTNGPDDTAQGLETAAPTEPDGLRRRRSPG
jgi:carbon storage regulator